MTPTAPDTLHFWQLLTRLGEAQILLPAALLAGVLLWRRPGGALLAAWWLGLLVAAVALTTASKVAFIGWGLGWTALDFTGISGHAMFSASIYPLLLATLVPSGPRAGRALAVAAGAALAGLIGWSRLEVHAHSVSEVAAGLALGGLVSAAALMRGRLPASGRLRPWVPALVALWLATMPAYAPPSQTHPMVTRLALALSGRETPHTRADLRRRGPALDGLPAGLPVDSTPQ